MYYYLKLYKLSLSKVLRFFMKMSKNELPDNNSPNEGNSPNEHNSPNEEKQPTIIENYLICKESENTERAISKFYALQTPNFIFLKPTNSIWEFMKEEELEQLLKLRKRAEIKKRIDSKLEPDFPKGNARTLYIELMYNATMFCKKWGISLEKSAAVLSQFHLTHIYFTSSFNISAEKTYLFFKELALSHTLPFPPENIKIFSHNETKIILEFFCKLYLRFLPLIRFLSLPNFAFYLEYKQEDEVPTDSLLSPSKHKGKTEKRGKKGKPKTQKSSTSKK